VGEELALAAGLATLGRTIAIAGEVGNAAYDVYQTVQDPKSAVVNILGMLLGVGAIARVERTGKGLGDVAKIRRGMTADTVSAFGPVFKGSDDALQNVIHKLCSR
jgi:chitinase